jgi:hypothetical protein
LIRVNERGSRLHLIVPKPTGVRSRKGEVAMIVVTRKEKTIVLTGWRAWLAGAAALIVAWCALAFVAFVVIGITVTLVTAFVILLPAAVIVAIVAAAFRR